MSIEAKFTTEDLVTLGLAEHWFITPDAIDMDDGGIVIGQGAFGEVRKGSICGSTEVAVKSYKRVVAEFLVQDFANEIRLLRRLRHPNIVLLHGASIVDMSFVLVLEWIAGGDLGQYVQTRRKTGAFQEQVEMIDMGARCLPAAGPQMLHEHKLLLDTAKAMQYLHTQIHPIMHRDLKPSNVLVDTECWPPRAKIADFGLSVIIKELNDFRRVGTPWCMAPEVSAGSPYGLAADAYSFGCVTWFVVTGKKRCPPIDAIHIILQWQFPVPAIVDVTVSCLAVNPSDRPTFRTIFEWLHSTKRPFHDDAQPPPSTAKCPRSKSTLKTAGTIASTMSADAVGKTGS